MNRLAESASWSPQAAVPVVLNRFIGRRAELAELMDLVGRRRLVTIVGPGGCGKTRLGIETLSATQMSGGRVRWVDLSPVTDAGRVAEVAAAAIGVPIGPGAGPTGTLIAMLRDQQLVIGFDNCEHVLPACADLIESLLAACPGVVVLATSRERLAVAAEAAWRVPSMTADDVVELFAERARAVRNDFIVDDANSDAVRTVCRRLDGIPLAVELAAAWVRILTPVQIAAALNDRFRLLVATPARRVPRQQTLAASVEWSYGLLREPARVLLRRLAAFAGGFTLAGAEAVCSDELLPVDGILDALSRLVDTSIVVVGERAGEARFQLPETIRQFATDRLVEAGEWTAVRDRHLDHVLASCEHFAELYDNGNQDDARLALDVDYDNVLAALDWGLGDPERHVKGRRLAAAMVRHWFLNGNAGHGLSMIERAIAAAPDDRSELQARLYCGLALVAMPAGRLQLLHDAVERAEALGSASGDARTVARATAIAGYEYFYTDYQRAVTLGRQAQLEGEAAGDAFAVDFGMIIEAVALGNQDRFHEVGLIADALLERCEARHERFAAAFSRTVLMFGAMLTGDVGRGVELGRHAVRLAAPLGDYLTAGTTVGLLASVCGVAGLVDEGRQMMDGVARMIADADADADVVDMHTTIGALELLAGDLEAAVRWLERAVTFSVAGAEDNWTVARALPSLAGAYRRAGRLDTAEATARRGVDMATRLGTWHMAAESLDELALAVADRDPVSAYELHHEALTVRVEHGLRTHMVDSIDGLAHLAAVAGAHADAARLFAASDTARTASGYPRPPVDEQTHAATIAALRDGLGASTFDVAYSEGARLDLDETVGRVRRMRGSRQRPTFGWSSLTPTEQQVVALVAEGLTNPQIAERMFVSRATIKTHLSNVFTKLAVTSRAELAAQATRRAHVDDGD